MNRPSLFLPLFVLISVVLLAGHSVMILAQSFHWGNSQSQNIFTNQPDVPWPDLGEPAIIEPGIAGTINDFIRRDLNTDGTRRHHHYILRRNGEYIYTSEIVNDFPLMITAEDGEGAIPVIRPQKPVPGESESPRAFRLRDDFYLKDIHIVGYDENRLPADNATIRLNADGIRCVIRNTILEYNRKSLIRIDRNNTELFLTNNLFFNAGSGKDYHTGYPILIKDAYVQHLSVQNNTFVNATNAFIQTIRTSGSSKMSIEHNTFVHSGVSAFQFGKPDTLVFRNNLIVNPGILGDGWDGIVNNDVEDLHLFDVDSFYLEDPLSNPPDPTMYVKPVIHFNNNHLYINPEISKYLPDTSNNASMFIFDSQIDEAITDEDSNLVFLKTFTFDGFSVDTADYKNFINEYYTADTICMLPGYDKNPLIMSFAYNDSIRSFQSSSDHKLPLGDLNWFEADSIPLEPFFKDSLALRNFYLNLSGWDDLSWTMLPVSHWEGVGIRNQRITKINLSGFNLTGKFHNSIRYLDALDSLILRKNQLFGKIPSTLRNLENLIYLDLGYNKFNGQIPGVLNDMPELKVFKADYNYFDSISNLQLSSLDILTLNNNKLTFNDLIDHLPDVADTVYYIPQDAVGESIHEFLFEGDSFKYIFPDDHPDNKYQWFKTDIDTVIGKMNSLNIISFTINDTGTYYCIVTNPKIPGLTLNSNQIILDIHPPLKISNTDFQVFEDAAIGASIGTLQTNTDDSIRFQLIDPGGFFNVDEQKGMVTVNLEQNYEEISQHEITVVSILKRRDEINDTSVIQIFVIDVNEPPVVKPATFEIAEKSPPLSVLGEVQASDPDSGDVLQFSLLENPNDIFSIDAVTGNILVNDSSYLDQELNPTLFVTVMAADDNIPSLTDTTQIRIDIITLVSSKRLNHPDQKPVLYPNPANDRLFLFIPENNWKNESLSLEFYDAAGKQLKSIEIIKPTMEKHSLDVSNLRPGFYILKLRQGGRIFSYRFFKM